MYYETQFLFLLLFLFPEQVLAKMGFVYCSSYQQPHQLCFLPSMPWPAQKRLAKTWVWVQSKVSCDSLDGCICQESQAAHLWFRMFRMLRMFRMFRMFRAKKKGSDPCPTCARKSGRLCACQRSCQGVESHGSVETSPKMCAGMKGALPTIRSNRLKTWKDKKIQEALWISSRFQHQIAVKSLS